MPTALLGDTHEKKNEEDGEKADASALLRAKDTKAQDSIILSAWEDGMASRLICNLQIVYELLILCATSYVTGEREFSLSADHADLRAVVRVTVTLSDFRQHNLKTGGAKCCLGQVRT